MLRHTNNKGQSTLEYAFLITTVIIALIAIRPYVQRAFQGRMKSASQSISEELYDPASAEGQTTQTMKQTSTTLVETEITPEGNIKTTRTDTISDGEQTRTGGYRISK